MRPAATAAKRVKTPAALTPEAEVAPLVEDDELPVEEARALELDPLADPLDPEPELEPVEVGAALPEAVVLAPEAAVDDDAGAVALPAATLEPLTMDKEAVVEVELL